MCFTGIAEIVGVQIGLALIIWLNNKKWMAVGMVMLMGGSASIASLALPWGGKVSTIIITAMKKYI